MTLSFARICSWRGDVASILILPMCVCACVPMTRFVYVRDGACVNVHTFRLVSQLYFVYLSPFIRSSPLSQVWLLSVCCTSDTYDIVFALFSLRCEALLRVHAREQLSRFYAAQLFIVLSGVVLWLVDSYVKWCLYRKYIEEGNIISPLILSKWSKDASQMPLPPFKPHSHFPVLSMYCSTQLKQLFQLHHARPIDYVLLTFLCPLCKCCVIFDLTFTILHVELTSNTYGHPRPNRWGFLYGRKDCIHHMAAWSPLFINKSQIIIPNGRNLSALWNRNLRKRILQYVIHIAMQLPWGKSTREIYNIFQYDSLVRVLYKARRLLQGCRPY